MKSTWCTIELLYYCFVVVAVYRIIIYFELRPRNSSTVQVFGLGLDGTISNLSFYQAHFILRSINIVDSLVPGLLSSADVITYYGVHKNENLSLAISAYSCAPHPLHAS